MDYAQVVAIFANNNVQWPSILTELFNILSAFNLNLDLIAPECALPSVTYWQKWVFIEALPIAMFGTWCLAV